MSAPATLDGKAPESVFAALDTSAGVLAAVSGGPDSIAMMGLLARWAAAPGRPLVAVATVDHGLRPSSAAEAAAVAVLAAKLNLPHRILAWTGPKARTGLQEAARRARYRLLTEHARTLGQFDLVTAHTMEDQAETVLMRLARGSGLAGLGGMRPVVMRDGIRHVRPLLGHSKASLVQLCRAQGWGFVEDPSNADERFARARWRKLLPALAQEGLTPARLARLAERVSRAEAALHEKTWEALVRAGADPAQDGCACRLVPNGRVLLEEPFEIAVRALAFSVAAGRDEPGFLRLERVEACTEKLRAALAAGRSLRLTLAGTMVSLDRSGCLRLEPEPPRRRGRSAGANGDAAGSPHSLGKGGAHA